MTAVAKLLGDKDDWVRMCAAGDLPVFGKKAKSILPVLRKCLNSDDKRLKATVEKAIEKIPSAEDRSDEERAHREMLVKISKFRMSLRKDDE